MNLNELVSVAPRYARSVNLERDGFTDAAVDGYVITSTADLFLQRLGRALSGKGGHRAWTLTGPYGAGKSSFALFLANLFSPEGFGGSIAARELLLEQHGSTHKLLFEKRNKGLLGAAGFTAVVVSGASEPLVGAILRCVIRDVWEYFGRGRKPDVLRELENLQERFTVGKSVTTTDVMAAIHKLSESLVSSGRSMGLLLIIDELGKFLEFAARTSTAGDIYLLQQLAEATNHTSAEGLYLVTVLHQSFERYAAELAASTRDEWAKVQGRFEDVAFQETPEQLLELISRAIVVRSHPAVRPLVNAAKALAHEAVELELTPRGMAPRRFEAVLSRCAPLHPLAALALVRLCQKFGQNQRSLFSFLTSREKFGFSSFLQRPAQAPSFFGLADLYDFLTEGFGSGLAVGESAARWAEVQNALDRGADLGKAERSFIKVLGLLAAIGQVGAFRASEKLIRFALGLGAPEFKRIKRLLLDRSLIVERRHNNTLALWEGSDLDLNEEVRKATRLVASNASLAEKLNQLWAPRPLVAKEHSFKTGTLRYFGIRFADVATYGKSLTVDPGADGLLLYCLPQGINERATLIDLASEGLAKDRPEILVAVPSEVSALSEAVRELEALRYVQLHTRELEADGVARRELRARISIAEARVSLEVQRLFAPEEQTAKNTTWLHRGFRQPVPTSRTLAHKISTICNNVYPATPILLNELVNRRVLSSAAAAARGNLFSAMIAKHAEANLGIEGTPPEMSIYSSILKATGIHRPEGELFAFGPPSQNDKALSAVWNAITQFFADCEHQRTSVASLFSTLQAPPFGLKMGVIPIFFCAAALAFDSEIAFYENGAFVADLTPSTFERLVKAPDTFEIRHYRIEGLRRDVYIELAHLFGKPTPTKGESLLSVIRPLFLFLHRLPEFCKNTNRIEEQTARVRLALMTAKEPDKLLFVALPEACGMEPFDPSVNDRGRVSKFFSALRNSITELQRAYDELLQDLAQLLCRAFDAPNRSGLQDRSKAVLAYCVDPRFKAVVNHLSNEHMDDNLWIEAVATTIVGKAPKSWTDDDRVRFEIGIAELSRNVRHLEALLYEEHKRVDSGQTSAAVYRIGVADRLSMEVGAVVTVEQDSLGDFQRVIEALEDERLRSNVSPQVFLAALASVSKAALEQYLGQNATKTLEVAHGKH
ncbi:hypothetical protein [Terriglobus tenax]|uniref:hypothetical protein n=1 Tax=Terriglobus tenax TaxID=1111115 RepID=UPI0021E038E6|nr:hypothetical protein [Terriglobus tenax]